MSKQPAMQFYTGDWMKDPALRMCSIGSRGMWMDMLCLMHESAFRGYLRSSSGRTLEVSQVCRACGVGVKLGSKLITELIEMGVASQDDDGTIFNRRMVRQDATSKARSDAAKKSWKENSSRDFARANPRAKQLASSSTSASASAKRDLQANLHEPPSVPSSGRAAAPLSREEWDEPDPQQLADALARELCSAHWYPSSIPLGKSALERLLAVSVQPGSVCEAIRKTHSRWREFPDKPKSIAKQQFHYWISDGMYLNDPPTSVPKRAMSGYERDMAEAARLEKEEAEEEAAKYKQ